MNKTLKRDPFTLFLHKKSCQLVSHLLLAQIISRINKKDRSEKK